MSDESAPGFSMSDAFAAVEDDVGNGVGASEGDGDALHAPVNVAL